MSEVTLGQENAGPRIGDVIVSELHYGPVDLDLCGPLEPSDFEFIEIYNRTASTVDMSGWRLRGGVDLMFSLGARIAPHSTLVVVPFDPEDSTITNVFRFAYNVDPAVTLIGPYDGRLDNGGETVRLEWPDEPPLEGPDFVPYVVEEWVRYDNQAPWPAGADGTGASLSRVGSNVYGNLPGSWSVGPPTPGLTDFSSIFRLAGDANEDGQFDQFDLLLVAKAAKYSTGQVATWAEGDWNGDGVFDQFDIIAAASTDNYLKGPYGASI